jgi:hypothetical protein
MHADRGVDVRILVRQRQHLREVRQVDRHAQRMGDFVVRHLRQDVRHASGQLREIDMAVRIDIHAAIVPYLPRCAAFVLHSG